LVFRQLRGKQIQFTNDSTLLLTLEQFSFAIGHLSKWSAVGVRIRTGYPLY